jgi:hypothetical protein
MSDPASRHGAGSGVPGLAQPHAAATAIKAKNPHVSVLVIPSLPLTRRVALRSLQA